MKITCLVENTCGREGLGCEHGLSFFVETEGKKLLFDMGAGPLFHENAEKLDIDLCQADMAFLSHGHADHGGGLEEFLRVNSHAPVYVREEAFGGYYSEKDDGFHDIGLKKELCGHPQIRLVKERTFQPETGLLLFSGVSGTRMFPESNRNLKEKSGEAYLPDRFLHEQNLVVSENGKAVLFAGCAHSGILNILDRCTELLGRAPDAVIGGFHLNSPTVGAVSRDYVNSLAAELLKYGSEFYTCHCTGEQALRMLKESMDGKIHGNRTGESLNI